MNSFFRIAAVAAALTAAASFAVHAEILDLSEYSSQYTTGLPVKITSMGFEFGSPTPVYLGPRLYTWGTNDPASINLGGVSIFNGYAGDTVVFKRSDGNAFEFNSIDMGDIYNRGTWATVQFNFLDMNNIHSTQSVRIDDYVGSQTFYFDKTNLSQVSWVHTDGPGWGISPTAGWGQFANINVSAVPEPESYAMLLAGLGLMGFMVRRHHKTTGLGVLGFVACRRKSL